MTRSLRGRGRTWSRPLRYPLLRKGKHFCRVSSSLSAHRAISPQEEKQRLVEELQEAEDSARRRSLGNIKFIGELFKLKMLTEVIMHDCIVKLLKNHDEESLECLCRLLSTIGKDLDFEKAKVR